MSSTAPSSIRNTSRETGEFLQSLKDHLEEGDFATILDTTNKFHREPGMHVELRVAVLTVRAQAFLDSGRSEKCKLTVAKALQEARSGRAADQLIATAITTAGWAALSMGEVGTALRLSRDAVGAFLTTSAYNQWEATGVLEANCLAAQDRFQEAKDTLYYDRTAAATDHPTGYGRRDLLLDLGRTRIHLALDEMDSAFDAIDRVHAFLERASATLATPCLRATELCLRAQILIRCGRLDEADAALGDATLRIGACESEKLTLRWTRVLLNTAAAHPERTKHDVRWLTSKRALTHLLVQEPVAAVVLAELAMRGDDPGLGSSIQRTISTLVDSNPGAASLRAAMLCAETVLGTRAHPVDHVVEFAKNVARPQVIDYIVDRSLVKPGSS